MTISDLNVNDRILLKIDEEIIEAYVIEITDSYYYVKIKDTKGDYKWVDPCKVTFLEVLPELEFELVRI